MSSWRACSTVIALVCVGILGCSKDGGKTAAAPVKLSPAQRDSVTANSRSPGAGALKRTLSVADSAAARVVRENETSK
jgi:hypothetical protein